MRALISHLRYAIRLLLKSPGFAFTAVLILGLGIGANTAIFSLVNGVLLRPLPYPQADRLVEIYQPFQGHQTSLLNYPDFVQYSAAQHTFENLTAFLADDFTFLGQSGPERLGGLWVSGTFFKVLGRPFLMGRPIENADDNRGAPAVVVLSERFWRAKFNADPKIVGAKLVLDSKSYQVIGVTPGQADEASIVDLYLPLAQNPDNTLTSRTGSHYFSCIGRLKDGVSLRQAKSDLEVISRNLVDKYPASVGFGIWLVPYLDNVTGDYSTTVWVLESAVFCVLLITCANVANLILARAQDRRREMTVRAALGANRGHIIGQLLSESVVLASIGGVIGFPMAILSTALVKQLVPPDVPRFQEFGIDGGSLLFVLGVTIFAALASGLLPAWIVSRSDVASSLKEEGHRGGTAGPRRQRGQAVLVAVQVALTCLLLIAASLLTRSFVGIENAPLGFKTDHILTADIYLSDAKYSTQAASRVFLDALLDKLQRLPGVISAGFSDNLPFKGENRLSFGIKGRPDPEPWKLPVWQAQTVSADFFRTLGITLLRGRWFSDQGGNEQLKEVIVSERLADAIFPGQEAVGKQLHDYNSSGRHPNWYTIVGIVPNIQHNSPGADRSPYQAYFLYSQDPFAPSSVSFCTVILHTEGDALALASSLKQLVGSIDPNIPLSHVDTFYHVVEQSFAGRRLGMTVVSLFSIVALMLAGVGLYGVISYSIAQRKREIGVRIALGAQASTVVSLVMRRGLKIVLLGLVVGVVIALSLGHLMDSMLYRVSAIDPLSIGISVLVLGLSAFVACLLPAYRATQIDPITALRE